MLVLLRIAFRNVIRNRRRSLITLSAVFVAIGIMVSVRGLLNGLQGAIRENVVQGQTGAIQIHRHGFLTTLQTTPLELDLPADDAFLARIRAVPGVVAVAARIPFGGMINVKDTTLFALFFAFDPVAEPRVCPQRFDIVEGGARLDPNIPDGVDLSEELLRRLGSKLGDTVTLVTGDRDGVLNAADVRTIGSLGTTKLPMPDHKLVYLPLAAAQSLLRMEGRATEIAIGIDNLDAVDVVTARLRAIVGPDYDVATWHDVATFVDDIIRIQNWVISLIAFIFIVVALIGIANTMLLNVLERTREIGTMVSLGMRRRQVRTMFLLEAALLGVIGGVSGAVAGCLFVWHYSSGPGMTFAIPGTGKGLVIHLFITAPYLAFVFTVVVVGAALAAFYPALWASRLRPVQALSHT